MTTLDRVPPGSRCRIESLAGSDEMVQRLLEFGLLEGEMVEVIGWAPMGDPMEIRVGNTRLSVRKHDASMIQVSSVTPS